MAKILGQSGRYVMDEVVRQKRRILTIACVMIAFAGTAEGIVIASYLPPIPINNLPRSVVFILLLVLLVLLPKWAETKVSELERKQKNYKSGAQGENVVSIELARFPDDYYVINDLKTDHGNLDHAVIGPTGVFVIDAKNWRGVVSADGKGELLQNEKPTDKQEVKLFVGRMMGIKERVQTLTRIKDTYFQALFVFTSARVEASWGKTGNAHCLREDQLFEYIVEKDFGTKLKPEQVETIARAFGQLAHMEVDFTEKAKS
jgi:hypothetical protein